VVVFDGRGGSKKRREIFSEYKENRKSMTKLNRAYDFDTKEAELENQKRQLIQLVEAMTFLPLTVISVDNVEADDVLAYLAKLVSERDGDAYIMSNDKDFLQLVDTKIRVYNPTKKKIYTEDAVVEEYGIHPSNFMIFRTIDGDSSDNIPGVKGVGPATLIKNFPELATDKQIPWAHIYSQCEEKIEAAKQAKKKNVACQIILDNKEIIERNMTLMRLDEQHMSGHTRIKVLEQFDAPINSLNKLSLTQLFVKHRLLGGFTNLDEWLTTTFVPLTRYSEKS
jgi:DNA polymerase-1